MKSLIQPYELLGVATNSTPKEVRKAYYQLALLCHPDKGGDPKDMHMIHYAYEWVMKQIEGVDTSYTYEKAQQEFDDFIAAQNKQASSLPSFTDILLESNGLNEKCIQDWYTSCGKDAEHYTWFQRFLWQELLQSCDWKRASIFEHAYQKMMESLRGITKMSVTHGYGSFTETLDTPQQTFPTKQLIVYTEQTPFSSRTDTYTDIHVPNQMDDYSTACASLHGYDYSLAFTNQEPTLENELSDVCAAFADKASILDRLGQMEKEREMMDQDVATSGEQNRLNIVYEKYLA